MAKNTGDGFRRGSVNDRTQFQREDGNFQKRNTDDGRFGQVKDDGKPFKGVAKEVDDRRT
jgi:transcriptional regulator of nitric oxide reductase